jgi:cephalosporin-C deacetylase-like acetyl esterase
MGKYSRIVRYLDTVDRNPEYKIDRTLNYYDLMNLVTDRNLKYKIKNCILYFNMNNSSKKYFFNKNIKISGIIV